jgi:hypothetical protein
LHTIKKYFKGVKLDKKNIEYNPGLRAVMKLLLNSFWGKFGQETNKSQTKFINNTAEWYELMCHDKYLVNHIDMSIDGVVICNYKQTNEQFESTNYNVNVVLASFVTCYARLQLYKEMKLLGERVIYHDTDSLKFSVKAGEYEPKTGNFLGDLTNEISQKHGGYITEIVCPGPKNYTYRTALPKAPNEYTKCVIKGFTLNDGTKKLLNFDSIKEKLLNNNYLCKINDEILDNAINVPSFSIIRCNNHQLKSTILRKKYGIKYTKRIVRSDLGWKTYPFGYKFSS